VSSTTDRSLAVLTSTLQIGFRRAGCAINSAICEAH